ncbi:MULTISPECIES: phosphatase PAP2 family protein [unclassified Paraflavitalea]|uniref:phosphatase PAP2 family protein n=1 Tax=unclassified Paraflavitalea TaxID=2798305 RepID=UPI003D324AE8
MKKSQFIVSLLLLIASTQTFAQDTAIVDSKSDSNTAHIEQKSIHITGRSFILPAIMFGYGVSAIKIQALKDLNNSIKEEMVWENPHPKQHADNFCQFTPAILTVALSGFGVKAEHKPLEQVVLFGLTNVVLNTTVTSIKRISHQQRPDSSSYESFPSGHTAEGFAGAEMMRLEFQHQNPLLAYSGYLFAAATGYLRIYNNKHWFSDVVAGAGVGIASTRFTYWVYPKLKKWVFKKSSSKNIILPTYKNGAVGLCFQSKF